MPAKRKPAYTLHQSTTNIHALLGRHATSDEITLALSTLKEQGKVECREIATKGRPKTEWFRAAN